MRGKKLIKIYMNLLNPVKRISYVIIEWIKNLTSSPKRQSY